MFKQVFAKLFKSSQANQSTNSDCNRYDQPQIYAIPTISSCFQSNTNVAPTLTNYYNNNENNQSVSSSCKSMTNTKSTECKQYNDSNTRHVYIAPHCIRYTNSTLDDTIYRIDDDCLNEIAAEILDSDNMPPKLQIVFYNGNYFAINNSHLQIYKQLQLSGLITHVQADLISVEAIPIKLRDHLLQTPSHLLELEDMSNELLVTDEEVIDEELFEGNNRISTNSSSTSSGHSANVDSASDNETNQSFHLNNNKLVDETYEFGLCENCIESDEEEEDDEQDIDSKNSVKLERSYYEDLNLEFNLMTTKKIISDEIMKLRPPKLKMQTNHKLNSTSQKVSFKKSSQILNEADKCIEACNTILKIDQYLLRDEQEDSNQEDERLIESELEFNEFKDKSKVKNAINEKELENLLENDVSDK